MPAVADGTRLEALEGCFETEAITNLLPKPKASLLHKREEEEEELDTPQRKKKKHDSRDSGSSGSLIASGPRNCHRPRAWKVNRFCTQLYPAFDTIAQNAHRHADLLAQFPWAIGNLHPV